MQWNAVRMEEELLKSVDAIEAEWFLDTVGQIWIVEADVETEGFGSQRHRTTNPTESYDAKCVAAYPRATLER